MIFGGESGLVVRLFHIEILDSILIRTSGPTVFDNFVHLAIAFLKSIFF